MVLKESEWLWVGFPLSNESEFIYCLLMMRLAVVVGVKVDCFVVLNCCKWI